MSAIDEPGIRTAALQAAATLARYERHVRRLAGTWLDMDLYRTVSAEIDAIGRHCGAVPGVRVPWVALLVSHADLVHALLRAGDPGRDSDREAALQALEEHLACIDSLARRCLHAADANRRSTTIPGVTASCF